MREVDRQAVPSQCCKSASRWLNNATSPGEKWQRSMSVTARGRDSRGVVTTFRSDTRRHRSRLSLIEAILDAGGERKGLRQARRPAQPSTVVDWELLAEIVVNAEEAQCSHVLAARVGDNVVEQDGQHAVARHGGEQALQLGAERADVGVEEKPPPTAAQHRDVTAVPAIVLQVPRATEVTDVFQAEDQHLGVQRWRHVYRIAEHNDEDMRLRLKALLQYVGLTATLRYGLH